MSVNDIVRIASDIHDVLNFYAGYELPHGELSSSKFLVSMKPIR